MDAYNISVLSELPSSHILHNLEGMIMELSVKPMGEVLIKDYQHTMASWPVAEKQ